MIIKQLQHADEIPWDLLLLADPSPALIETYIKDSEVYVGLTDDKVIGVYVLTPVSKETVELKNIAVHPEYQNQGIGKQLVLDAIQKAKDKRRKRIEVGTGNSSLLQLALYQKCGFRIVGIEKDFFTKNYQEEIIENGIRCVDMIRLAIDI